MLYILRTNFCKENDKMKKLILIVLMAFFVGLFANCGGDEEAKPAPNPCAKKADDSSKKSKKKKKKKKKKKSKKKKKK